MGEGSVSGRENVCVHSSVALSWETTWLRGTERCSTRLEQRDWGTEKQDVDELFRSLTECYRQVHGRMWLRGSE